MKPYPKYKDSGIEWIGKIPEHWEVKKLKHCVKSFLGGGTPKSSEDSNWTDSEDGIAWVSIADITNQKNILTTEKYITEKGLKEKNLKILPKGTILYSIYASLGKVAELEIDATTNQAILGIIHKNKYLNKFYLKYWLNYMELNISILASSNTQDNLNAEKVKNIPIYLPTLFEQSQIASFLDRETANINNLIEKYGKLIELLKEKRIALINHAVTKGLNPDVKMKDSGIKWIGEIPEHWDVKKLKYSCIINKKTLGEETNPSLKINYLDISNVNNTGSIISTEELYFEDAPSRARRVPDQKDTIISTVRTYLKAIAYLDNIPDKLIVSTGFAVLHPDKEIMPKHLFYVTLSENFIQKVIADSTGVAYPAINPFDLGQIKIILPSKSEQLQIASYLDKETQKIDLLIEKINKQIELLNEYKTSLISHTVTGKIDVRETS